MQLAGHLVLDLYESGDDDDLPTFEKFERALQSIVENQLSPKDASKVLKRLLRITQMNVDGIIRELEKDDDVLEEVGVLKYMALLNFKFQCNMVQKRDFSAYMALLNVKSRYGKMHCDKLPPKKLLGAVVSRINSRIEKIGDSPKNLRSDNKKKRKCQEAVCISAYAHGSNRNYSISVTGNIF